MQPLQLGISRLALIVASEKGGVRKTSTAAVLHDYWEESGFDVTLVQVDKQGRLDALFPGRVITIDMPTTADMRADDLADARALAPALDILLSPNPGVRIFDIGANFDRRYFDWAVSMGLAEDCRKLGIDVIGLVPMTSDADAVTLGARTAVRFGLAFPDYLTLPVLCDDGVDVTKLLDSNTRQVFERAFGAKVERGEFLKHHRLLPGALAMLEASRLSASRLRLATARNISFHHTFPPAMTVRPRRAALGKSGGRGSTRSGR